jgi:hypothetical protein
MCAIQACLSTPNADIRRDRMAMPARVERSHAWADA